MWDRKGKKGADLWRWLPHSLGNELLDVKAVLRITRINPRMGIRNYIIFFDNTIYNGYSNKNYFCWNEVEIHEFKLKICMTRNNIFFEEQRYLNFFTKSWRIDIYEVQRLGQSVCQTHLVSCFLGWSGRSGSEKTQKYAVIIQPWWLRGLGHWYLKLM